MSGFAHTPGPWSIRDGKEVKALSKTIGPSGWFVNCKDGKANLWVDAKADADRISSTVNACDAAGLTNAALDAGVIGQLVDLIADVLVAKDEFDQGRDYLEGRHGDKWIAGARAALALARGDAS